MNKKLMALAVAGVFAAPAVAFAQASNVQIYGRANLALDNYQATGATFSPAGDFKARMRVIDNSSRIGFRGTEDLGNGLRAIFLMESGVNVDTGNLLAQSGAYNTSSGTLSSRIGYVGLEGNWGSLTLGRNNVWWANWAQEQTGANYVNASVPFFSGGFGRGMAGGLTARVSNLAQYTTPTWSGFNAILSYSPGSEAVQASGVAAGQTNTDSRVYGVTINGAWGPISGGYDWVNNKAATPTPPNAAGASQGETIGNKFRIAWAYQPGGQISLLWVSTKLNNGGAAGGYGGLPEAYVPATGAGSGLKQTGWGLNWEHIFGNIQALAQWGKVNNISGCTGFQGAAGASPGASNCAGTGATTWMLGARYLMSKRTAAYISYNQIRNDNNYNMDYNGGAMTSAFTATPAAAATNISGGLAGLPAGSVGADPRIWAVGIIHNF